MEIMMFAIPKRDMTKRSNAVFYDTSHIKKKKKKKPTMHHASLIKSALRKPEEEVFLKGR